MVCIRMCFYHMSICLNVYVCNMHTPLEIQHGYHPKKWGFVILNVHLHDGKDTLRETNSLPLKIGHPKRKLVFQPSIFRCHVSFREGVIYWHFSQQKCVTVMIWSPPGCCFKGLAGRESWLSWFVHVFLERWWTLARGDSLSIRNEYVKVPC